jgi:hypothetical protein
VPAAFAPDTVIGLPEGKTFHMKTSPTHPRRLERGPYIRPLLSIILILTAVAATGCARAAEQVAGHAVAEGAAAERAAAERVAEERAAEEQAARERQRNEREPNNPNWNINVTPSLTLSPSTVPDGTSYLAAASGFLPGEDVEFSWTGLSSGVITDRLAGVSGRVSIQVQEGAAPGDYLIIAKGLTSGQTASADLLVTSN